MIGEIILLIIGMFLSFFAMAACTFGKPSEKNKYCFMASIGAFIYFMVSFLILFSTSKAQFMMLQKISLTAGLYMLIGTAFAISCMFNVKFSNKLKLLITIGSFLLVIIFLTFTDKAPWVKLIDEKYDSALDITFFVVKGDWFYYLLNSLVLIAFIIWIVVIFIKTASQKGREFRLFRYLTAFAMLPLFIWVFSAFSLLPSSICNEIVFMLLLMVVMHVEIFFNLTDNEKDYNDLLLDNTYKGVIILDYKKRYVRSNKTAELTFDIISKNNKDAITAFINVNLLGEEYYYDGHNKYKITQETISDETNPRKGYAVWIEKVEKENTQD